MQKEIGVDMLKYAEIVKTIELEPISVKNGEELQFRIEILKDKNKYKPQLWRVETYRISSSFGDNDVSDEECLVKDSLFLENISEDSIEKCIHASLEYIQQRLLSV